MTAEVAGLIIAAAGAAASAIGVAWKAGGDYQRMRGELAALKKETHEKFTGVERDMNGIANTARAAQAASAKRYHNMSMVAMLIAPPAKEHEVVQLLKEE